MAIGSITIVDTLPGPINAMLVLQITLTGSYPGGGVTGGETLDLSGQAVPIQNPNGIAWEGFFENPGNSQVNAAGNPAPVPMVLNCQLNGYDVTVNPGNALTNWKFTVNASGNTFPGNVTYASLSITSPQNTFLLGILRRQM